MPNADFWRRLQVAKDSYVRLLECVDELADEIQAAEMDLAAAEDENAALKARVDELEHELLERGTIQ